MMTFEDPSTALLAASGGDTVKLFDLSMEPDCNQCTLSYSPMPGSQVNAVKWNHTNLVVASAGDDKKISLWHKNGQSLGTINSGDNINETISAISFSNKSSRYICSGGSGKVVRIWDLQRNRCIKRLKGHTDTITAAMYNCIDDHLASISLSGDLILHNLAFESRTILKDPNEQVLRVLDCSRISKHLLVTAGDDGSIHLWDTNTTRRTPKDSWFKQHLAPTTAVSFTPSNEKVIASVGLDKKLYTLDSRSKRPTLCIRCEAPFSSLAFRDDGRILAAGTNNGQVVFYDFRGKPQPITSLPAFSNSKAVTSLCWQRSKPNIVNENNCTTETALLGDAGEDTILMPDPLPSMTSSSLSLAAAVPGSRNVGRSSLSLDASSHLSTADETPQMNHLWTGASLSSLHPPSTSNFKDDMGVFSPLADVQPITPSHDERDEAKKGTFDGKPASLLFPSSMRRSSFVEESGSSSHPIFDWKSSLVSRQDDTRSALSLLRSTPTTSSRSEDSFPSTPPEAWGGEGGLFDKFDHRQPFTFQSRFEMTMSGPPISGTMAGLHSSFSSTGQMNVSSFANSGPSYSDLHTKSISSNADASLEVADPAHFGSVTTSLGTKTVTGQVNIEPPSPTFPRRFSTYAERISTRPTFGDGISVASGSPKAKKTGAETREELNLLRSDISATTGGGGTSQLQRGPPHTDLQQSSSSFTLQLVQHTLEETLSSVHKDMRNLHIEILRQFHLQETEMLSLRSSVLELTKEVQSLRKENQQPHYLL